MNTGNTNNLPVQRFPKGFSLKVRAGEKTVLIVFISGVLNIISTVCDVLAAKCSLKLDVIIKCLIVT